MSTETVNEPLPKKAKRLLVESIAPKRTTTHGLCYRFQIFFRDKMQGLHGEELLGQLQSMYVDAETPNNARFILEQDPDVHVVSIGPGRPLMDPNQQVFDRQSASALLGVEVSTFDGWLGKGKIASDKNGINRFTRHRVLELARAQGEKAEAA